MYPHRVPAQSAAELMADAEEDDELNPDARPAESNNLSTENILHLLQRERTAHANAKKELSIERAAHDETASAMVKLQERLEVTLQELANLERFTKWQQQQPKSTQTAQQQPPPQEPPEQAKQLQQPQQHVERLLQEEHYLRARLLFVQKELAEVRGSKLEPASEPAEAAEDRAMEAVLSI